MNDKKKQEKEIILTGDQKNFRDDFEKNFIHPKGQKEKVIRVISSAPGSGKTTLIEETLRSTIENNPLMVDDMLDRGEKITILVFNKINKTELEKRFKKAEFPMNLFEISTVNSLFFRNTKEMIEKDIIGEFDLDYKNSFFTKVLIRRILESLVRGNIWETLLGQAEEKIKKMRIFSPAIVSNEMIDNIHALTNAYYGTALEVWQTQKIEEKAKFFKKDASFNKLFIMDEDAEVLEKIKINQKMNISHEELFFRIFINRVKTIANIREVEKIRKEGKKKIIPIVIEGFNNEEEDPFSDGKNEEVTMQEITEVKIVEKGTNIIKVPHSYYIKENMNAVSKDPELFKQLFRDKGIVFVDEGQDNTLLFLKFLHKGLEFGILEDVSVIGDSHQRIYGFASPDNFDILKYIKNNKNQMREIGVNVKEFNLLQTYRFGENIAKYVNHAFKTGIIGKEDVEDFVYPEALKGEAFENAISKASEKGSVGVICRTNQECSDMFIRLKKKGINVRLETSIKKELTDFAKKGADGLPDKKHREILHKIMSRFLESNPEIEYKTVDAKAYEEIMMCSEAKSFLSRAGYGRLIKYKVDEIEKYILPAQRGRKNVVGIGTPYPLKGQEMDYVFIAGNFMMRENENEQIVDIDELEKEFAPKHSKGIFDINDMFGENKKDMQEKEEDNSKNIEDSKNISVSDHHMSLKDFVKNELSGEDQEREVLYVALTRAKKGCLVEDTEFGRILLSHIPLDIEENKRRGDKVIEQGDFIKSLLSEEENKDMGLFSFDDKQRGKP